jgi:hypothetical protein
VFVYAALLACVSGWLYAHLQRFVNPTPFSLTASIEYLFMAVVGGAGNVWGAVIGATLITLLKEVLQSILPKLLGQTGQFEIIVFGILIVVLLQRAPDGLTPLFRAGCRSAKPARSAARARRSPIAASQPSPISRFSRCARAQGVRRPRRRQRPVVRAAARRDSRADRPERRRQEHDVQPDQRAAAADARARSASTAADRRAAAVRDRRARHRADVPARQAVGR